MDLNSSFFFWAKEDLRLVFMNVSCEDGWRSYIHTRINQAPDNQSSERN